MRRTLQISIGILLILTSIQVFRAENIFSGLFLISCGWGICAGWYGEE